MEYFDDGEGVTTNYQKWADHMEDLFKNLPYGREYFDRHAALNISSLFRGYMDGPTGLVRINPHHHKSDKVCIGAKTKVFKDTINICDEVKNHLTTHECGNFYLYYIGYSPRVPTFVKIDPDTYAPINLDEGFYTEGFWRVRYAWVGWDGSTS